MSNSGKVFGDPQASGSESLERAYANAKLQPASGPPLDQHLERITLLMDKAIRIPGTNIQFGLDPILGLFLPVAGDAIGAIVSAYIVFVSVRYGLPKIVIARMVFNVAADFAVGCIPFLGDAADFVWKVNTRNLRLLNKYASGEGRSFWSDWAWLFVLLGGLFLLVVGGLVFVYYALKAAGVGLI
ncbi:MAG TPA: DUF4112 domain-containing protein [Blastocatellia bacterium]|nr:DUF4112 domain-containing protein [Blastocatellia bacterium]